MTKAYRFGRALNVALKTAVADTLQIKSAVLVMAVIGKWMGVITWGWVVVLAPFWLPVALHIIIKSLLTFYKKK